MKQKKDPLIATPRGWLGIGVVAITFLLTRCMYDGTSNGNASAWAALIVGGLILLVLVYEEYKVK